MIDDDWGCCVIEGAMPHVTVTVATSLVMEPQLFETTAEYDVVAAGVTASISDRAPEIGAPFANH